MLTVEYPPGGSSASQRHNASTFVYVLAGSVVMQVAGGPETTLQVGDTFYESPADIHLVSRNASDSEPAKILVFFVKDVGAPSTVPAKQVSRSSPLLRFRRLHVAIDLFLENAKRRGAGVQDHTVKFSERELVCEFCACAITQFQNA
jgi:Cupin domain